MPAAAAWLQHCEPQSFLQQQHVEGAGAGGTLRVAHQSTVGVCEAGARPRSSLAPAPLLQLWGMLAAAAGWVMGLCFARRLVTGKRSGTLTLAF